MCGIAGLFDSRFSSAEAARIVSGMVAGLAHRGPDGEGLWADPRGRCVLGHRRLSVIDTSDAGRQPMSTRDGRWTIVTNGEIYNFEDLRDILARKGVTVCGRSDTEVLLGCLALWQTGALGLVDGMYAFAAFDSVAGELILARDPFGEKPLYYIELPDGGLAFASELSALEGIPGFDGEIDLTAIAELMMFQYVGHPRTIYASVRKLPPGTWLRARAGEAPRSTRYYRFAAAQEFEGRAVTDLADELEALLVTSIRRRLLADVPVGAFLSGGVDSSTVCALARHRLGRSFSTFTVGFAGTEETEHVAAGEFAQHLGLEHDTLMLAPDIVGTLERFGELLDEPNADWSCLPVYLLTQHARSRVTVLLSGDGGDELFGGYAWYFAPLERELRRLPGEPEERFGIAYAERWLMTHGPPLARLLGRVPSEATELLHRILADLNQPGLPLGVRLRRNEIEHYLPGAVLAKVDRMSMRNGLEVRTPFLNLEVARFAACLPPPMLCGAGGGKVLLRELARRYLPAHLVDRPKSGFGLPGSGWGGTEVRRVARRLLGDEAAQLPALLGREVVHEFIDQESDVHRVWTLALLESWLRSRSAILRSAA